MKSQALNWATFHTFTAELAAMKLAPFSAGYDYWFTAE